MLKFLGPKTISRRDFWAVFNLRVRVQLHESVKAVLIIVLVRAWTVSGIEAVYVRRSVDF